MLTCPSRWVTTFFSFILCCFRFLVSKFPAKSPSEVVDKREVEKRDWGSDILPDILEAISDRLSLCDFVVFRSVCRQWRSSPSGRSEITNFAIKEERRPWFMIYGLERDNTCYFYCHPHPNCCTIRLPQLENATVKESKCGWLLAHRCEHFFLFNPFTLAIIHFPDHKVYEDQACTTTILPSSQDCKVFIVSRIDDLTLEFSWCSTGDTEWNSHTEEVISKAQFGTLSAITVCDCANGHQKESCGLLDSMQIYIYGSNMELVYNYMQKSFVYFDQRFAVREKEANEAALNDVLAWKEYFNNPLYTQNWLERFGGKGISISTSGTKIRRTGAFRTGRVTGIELYIKVIGGEGESSTGLKSLKASWIEPSLV